MRLGMTASLLACVFGAGVAVGALALDPSALPATAAAATGTHHTATAAPGYGQAGAAPAGTAPAAPNQAGAAAQATIEINSFQFSGQVRVAPGGTVRVVNNDSAPHTATARNRSFDTGTIAGGATGSFTAPSQPGTYQFFCAVHPSMTGTLIVGTELGEVLVDGEGHTLYGFTKDEGGTPTCAGDCADAWPAALVEGDIVTGAGLDAANFSLVEGVDGGQQLKAGKWPLYRFAGDAAPGEINGQGSGGVWFAVAADGKLVKE